MSRIALTQDEETKSEAWLNTPENAPKLVERYAYNASDVKGIRYVEGVSISGSVRYIREDLCVLKEGVSL